MDLFEKMTNINGFNTDILIQEAILSTKQELKDLTEERTCKIYNSLFLRKILSRHIPARLINTLDLGFWYEHVFVIVSNKSLIGGGYTLVDLTFSQFKSFDGFEKLIQQGYQELEDIKFNDYLKRCTNQESFMITLDQAFYGSLEKENKRKI